MREPRPTEVEARVVDLVTRAWRRAPFYHHWWGEEGFDPRTVDGLATFAERVPLLRKQRVLEAQASDPPYGGLLCVGEDAVRQVNVTGGTSGMGMERYVLTGPDAVALGATYADGLRRAGVGPGSRVALTFPMSLSAAPQWIYDGLVAADVLVLPVGSYTTDQKLELMQAYAVDVLLGTPSYVEYLAREAIANGMSPAQDLSIRAVFVATESFSVERARRIESFYGARLHEWYGCTQRGIAVTCTRGAIPMGAERGILHFDHDRIVAEIVDPDSGAPLSDPRTQDLPSGTSEVEGELVLTSLDVEATPLIRFATRDRVRAVPASACDCGRRGFGLVAGTVSRYDAMLKIRGVTVEPAGVDGAILGLDGVIDHRVRLHHDDRRREQVTVTVEVEPDADRDQTLAAVRALFRARAGLEVETILARESLSTFDDTRRKAARWVDERER